MSVTFIMIPTLVLTPPTPVYHSSFEFTLDLSSTLLQGPDTDEVKFVDRTPRTRAPNTELPVAERYASRSFAFAFSNLELVSPALVERDSKVDKARAQTHKRTTVPFGSNSSKGKSKGRKRAERRTQQIVKVDRKLDLALNGLGW
ncbi:uncharacterized protein JCM15063_003525 [Sporobolomyces koalae]|uniref:uncharacterized protein n=1 Tax=Sporobolomyces koalae TaxID=500713 RepID=UPI00316C1C53